MAILDFLKNKEDSKEAKKITKKAEKPAKASVAKEAPVKSEKTEKVETSKSAVQKSKNSVNFSYEAIKKPHISEKATYLAENNQYVFEVLPNYNKTEIKKAIEGIYGVNVLSVNVVTTPPKKRRLGKVQGWRKEMTKAIVKIKEDQKIEIL
jgi:large subunit ribosomal protein L23